MNAPYFGFEGRASSRSFRSESKLALHSTARRRDASDFNAWEDRPSQRFAMTIRPSSNPTIFACSRRGRNAWKEPRFLEREISSTLEKNDGVRDRGIRDTRKVGQRSTFRGVNCDSGQSFVGCLNAISLSATALIERWSLSFTSEYLCTHLHSISKIFYSNAHLIKIMLYFDWTRSIWKLIKFVLEIHNYQKIQKQFTNWYNSDRFFTY